MKERYESLFVVAVLFYCTTTLTADENWPQFRGVNGTGAAPDSEHLPTSWTTPENVIWVAAVSGWGWSCPMVWGDRVFVAFTTRHMSRAILILQHAIAAKL